MKEKLHPTCRTREDLLAAGLVVPRRLDLDDRGRDFAKRHMLAYLAWDVEYQSCYFDQSHTLDAMHRGLVLQGIDPHERYPNLDKVFS